MLPVMFNVTYADVKELTARLSVMDATASDGASRDDAEMLKKLRRITMIHSNTGHVVRMRCADPNQPLTLSLTITAAAQTSLPVQPYAVEYACNIRAHAPRASALERRVARLLPE